MPISPRSPVVSEGRSAKGVGRTCPFLMTLISPARSSTKIRPSGAISKPLGMFRPSPTTSEVWKSCGTAAWLGRAKTPVRVSSGTDSTAAPWTSRGERRDRRRVRAGRSRYRPVNSGRVIRGRSMPVRFQRRPTDPPQSGSVRAHPRRETRDHQPRTGRLYPAAVTERHDRTVTGAAADGRRSVSRSCPEVSRTRHLPPNGLAPEDEGMADTWTEAPGLRYASGPGRWVLLATVLGSAMAGIDMTVVGIALPAIGREFHADMATLQWVVTGYTLTLAGLLLVAGALGDRYGRRLVFQVGLV